MISWIKRLLSKKARNEYNHDKIVEEYRQVACGIGDAISYMHMGDAQTMIRGKWHSMKSPEVYHILDELEVAYAELGYRIVPLDTWVDYAGWGGKMDDVWLVKRDKNERPHYTRKEPKRELPEQSDLLQKTWETGKAHESVLNEDGEIEIRQVEE
tara:strand:- start:45193 stop:45657 length:465 start_codon:yes stop_codon:yes gene_type:complete